MIRNCSDNVEKFREYIDRRTFCDIDIVDLINYCKSIYCSSASKNVAFEKLNQIINPKKKILFVLVDGLGAYKVLDLDESSKLRKNMKYAIKTVNPTSTGCVLTSLYTGLYPAEHGILGWWQYNRDMNLNFYPILFAERKTGIDLNKKGIIPTDIYRFKSIFDSFNTNVNIYMNREIINSTYSKYISGKKAKRYGTYSIKEAFDRISKNLKDQRESFNYLYIDGIDLKSHVYGTNSNEVNDTICEIEFGIKKIIDLNDDVTVIVTADHGQVDMTSMLYLNKNYDFSKYFYAMPSMDTRMISFYVRDEYKEEFEEKFIENFGGDVILLTKREVEDCNLFGNCNFSENIENSIGDYIAIIVNDKFMVCDKVAYEDSINTKGNHSGLTIKETTIPLIVFN